MRLTRSDSPWSARRIPALSLSLLALALSASGCTTSTAGTAVRGSGTPTVSVAVAAPSATASPTATPVVTASPTPTKKPVAQRLTTPIRTKTVDGGTVSYDVTVWAEDTLQDCQSHAYGAPVIAFLVSHPCGETYRQLLTLTLNGKEVGVSVIQTSFDGSSPDDPYDNAHQFAELVKKDGTGNINDLPREGKALPRGPLQIPATAAFAVLGQDSGVGIFEFWYTSGPTPKDAPELTALADVLFLNTFN